MAICTEVLPRGTLGNAIYEVELPYVLKLKFAENVIIHFFFVAPFTAYIAFLS